MKNLSILTLCLLFLVNANAQIISRSSIAAITANTSAKTGIISHHISKMNLTDLTHKTDEVAEASAPTVSETSEINETPGAAIGTLNAYPNPAVNNIQFSFEMNQAGKVSVSIYNVMGQKVADVYQDNYNSGITNHQIDLSTLSGGMYFLSLNFTADKDQQSHIITKKFEIVK
jgi:hypothetical protein